MLHSNFPNTPRSLQDVGAFIYSYIKGEEKPKHEAQTRVAGPYDIPELDCGAPKGSGGECECGVRAFVKEFRTELAISELDG